FLLEEVGDFKSENCGIYFPEVKREPGRYLHSCPESVKKWLRQLKNAGKILLLITSSHSDYCRLLCEYTLGNDFEDIFDIVITNALKPGFFSHLPSESNHCPKWLKSEIKLRRRGLLGPKAQAGKIRSRNLAGPEHSPTPANQREERIQSGEGVEVQACEKTSPGDLHQEC
ncbi:hypothetical protein MC885_016411, partial [Smutsia gigantea]